MVVANNFGQFILNIIFHHKICIHVCHSPIAESLVQLTPEKLEQSLQISEDERMKYNLTDSSQVLSKSTIHQGNEQVVFPY